MVPVRGPTSVPSQADYQRVFAEQNPGASTGEVPAVLAPVVERPRARSLWRLLRADSPQRFQLILGPRRVGKSTVMYQTVQHLLRAGVAASRLWWLRLDHPLLIDRPLGDLVSGFLEGVTATAAEPVYLFLDELTYGENWDLWLKTFYDDRWPVRLVGTTSATAALRQRGMESGVGRWEEQYLQPYLFSEFLELVEQPMSVPVLPTLAETIEACIDAKLPTGQLAPLRRRFLLTGGFPELLLPLRSEPLDETSTLLRSQRILRGDAIERAVYKDIPQLFNVERPLLLERLLYTLAGQVTGLLSPSGIGQALDGMSQPTFDRYLSYLERAFLVFTLPNYSGGEAQRQRRGRKLYFVDGAVRSAALQRGIAPLSDHVEMGLLLENMAASHLHALGQQGQVRVYHWRDRNDEVDLVYDHPEWPIAFEIGSSLRHSRAGMRKFLERFPRFRGRGYIVTSDGLPLHPGAAEDGIGVLPLDLMLVAVGAQAERELGRRLAVSD